MGNILFGARNCNSASYSVGAGNECAHISVNHTFCEASETHFSEYPVNFPCEMFKVDLSGLSVNTVSVPPVNVVPTSYNQTYIPKEKSRL